MLFDNESNNNAFHSSLDSDSMNTFIHAQTKMKSFGKLQTGQRRASVTVWNITAQEADGPSSRGWWPLIINHSTANVCSRSQCCFLCLNFMVLAFYEGVKLDLEWSGGEKNHTSYSVLDLQFCEITWVWHKLSVGWNTETILIITAYPIPYDYGVIGLNL